MKNLYALGFLCMLPFLHLNAQWTLNRPTNLHFSDILFTSADTGYAVGENAILSKSIDSGRTWQQQTTGIPNNLFALFFTDAQTGYACAGDTLGRIVKTVNAGTGWSVTDIPGTNYLIDIHFTGDSVGYCVGFNGKMVKTTDAGNTWTHLNTGTGEDLRAVFFPTSDTGYALAAHNLMLKTTDGGSTWSTLPVDNSEIKLDTYFTDANTGYVVGGGGIILKTTDGGSTWSNLNSGIQDHLQSVHFTSADTGYAVGGQGNILTTTDAGASWTSTLFGNFSGSYGWYAVTAIDSEVFIAGYEGKIARKGCTTPMGYDTYTECGPITWIDGHTYTSNNSSATYTFPQAGANGCDSIVSLDYQNIRVTNPGIGYNADSLYAYYADTAASYQWLDCDAAYQPIQGATQRVFKPTSNGRYAIEITANGCLPDTSSCRLVNNLKLENPPLHKVSIYPNPAEGQFYLQLGQSQPQEILVYDQTGLRVFASRDVHRGPYNLKVPPGLYTVQLVSDSEVEVFRLLVK